MYRFYRSCVDWPSADVHNDGGLCTLIDRRREITRRTFLKHANRDDLAELADQLGYVTDPQNGGLHMASDWHIEYFRSEHHGRRVYGFRHSAIEYVFTKGNA